MGLHAGIELGVSFGFLSFFLSKLLCDVHQEDVMIEFQWGRFGTKSLIETYLFFLLSN